MSFEACAMASLASPVDGNGRNKTESVQLPRSIPAGQREVAAPLSICSNAGTEPLDFRAALN